MIDMWITPVLLAFAFLYSRFYNTRRTEHPTYALWNTVLTNLRPFGFLDQVAGDIGDSIMVAPQYEVYVSANDKALDPNDTRASLETLPDNKTDSLFFDFAIILLAPAMRHNDPWPDSITAFFQQLLAANWTAVGDQLGRVVQAARIRILHTHILAAVELKRPPPRASKIGKWMRFLLSLIRAARSQAVQQAVYVLRSKRYEASMDHGMILIAGAGEWFSLRWVDFKAIKNMPDFDMEIFKKRMTSLAEKQAKLEALEDDINKKNEGQPLKSSAEAAKKQEEMTARAARYIKRAMGVLTAESAQQKKQALLALSPPFLDEELEEYWQLADKGEFDAVDWAPGSTFLQQAPARGIQGLTLDSLKNWTRPMRLGSPVGDLYMEFVRKRFETVAKEVVPFPPLPKPAK